MQDDKIFIGKTIKFFREKNNLTQQELAEKIDISDKHMSKIERGIYLPSLTNFIKLLSVLNVSISEFGFPEVEEHKSSRKELIELVQSAKEKEVEYFLTMFKATKHLLES